MTSAQTPVGFASAPQTRRTPLQSSFALPDAGLSHRGQSLGALTPPDRLTSLGASTRGQQAEVQGEREKGGREWQRGTARNEHTTARR